MDTGILILLVISLGTIFLVVQRTELKRRRFVLIVMFVVLIVIGWLVNTLGTWREAIVAVIISGGLNFLFYVLIGRYNPVGSSDNIRVLGMDD